MALGNLPAPGRPTILITVGQGPIALAVGAGVNGLDIFTLIYPFFSFSLPFGRRPDIDCLKGPLNPKQQQQHSLAYCFDISAPPPLPPKKKNQIKILGQDSLIRELKIRVVGFVHKKLLIYFEMLIICVCTLRNTFWQLTSTRTTATD